MEGIERQALILRLLKAMQSAGSWCGETHVQKCAYFLQQAFHVPLDFNFTLYKHGPFSFDLRALLGDMRGRLLIDVTPQGAYGPSLQASDSGEALLQRFPRTTGRYAGQIERVASTLGRKDVAELERLGTAFYVRNIDPSASPAQRTALITQLKPHISESQARGAVSEVDKILADR